MFDGAWQRAFFLAVLLAAVLLLLRAVRREAQLRRRHERFLAAVLHEFKSPVASLRRSLETLAMHDTPPAERSELARRIQLELGQLDRMVMNALDASRLASGGRAAPERVVLAELAEEARNDLHDFAQECEVRVDVQVPLAITLHVDRDGLRAVLRNLLHNAIKASHRAGVVTVQAQVEAHDVVLEVSDNGVGFAPKESLRIFEQFYRVEGDGRERMRGTGLGLYLVERSVTQAGGRVRAQSAGHGLGAVFTVRCPRPEAAE